MSSRDGEPTMDIYIRMNADPMKDYCFAVTRKLKVKDLMELFHKLPVNLSPTYFYENFPSRFAASVHPGYITAEGAMLFEDDSDLPQYLKHVDQEATVWEAFKEGQLVVPVWEYNTSRWLRFVTFLLTWLYLDLPQHLTPTPGIAPTMVLARLVQRYFSFLQEEPDAIDPMDTTLWRWLFFAVHVFKIGLIYLVFNIGVFNPRSLNPLRARKPVDTKITREDLISLGWTGSRRMTPDDWSPKYRDYVIDRAGGIVAAHMSGMLDKPAGISLPEGQGWSALRNDKDKPLAVGADLLTSARKFVISTKYLEAVTEPIALELADPEIDDTDKLDKLKDFRSYGYMKSSKLLEDLYDTILADTKAARKNALKK